MDTVTAKGLTIVILFLATLVMGWVPVWLHQRGSLTRTGSPARRLVLDLLHCVAGGVFLGVCLLHLLDEGREDFESYKELVGYDTDFPFFEAITGVGFFLIALIEKVGFALLTVFRTGPRKRPNTGGRCAPPTRPTLTPTPTSTRVPVNGKIKRGSTTGSLEADGAVAVVGTDSNRGPLRSSASGDVLIVPDLPPAATTTTTTTSMTAATAVYHCRYGAVDTSVVLQPSHTTAVASSDPANAEGAVESTSEKTPLLNPSTSGQIPNGRLSAGVSAETDDGENPGTRDQQGRAARHTMTTSLDGGNKQERLRPFSTGATGVLNFRGCQSLSSSLELGGGGGGCGEGVGAGCEVTTMMGAEQQHHHRHHHHHHHHSLAASTSSSCHSEDISEMSVMRALLLLVALSFHTVFDGLAVGLQETAAQVWGVLAGVTVHKAVVAFCLGLDLASTTPTTTTHTPTRTRSRFRPFLLMFLFSLISPVGVGVGMGVTVSHVHQEAQLLASSLLQALATGTFLYVTFFEILGRQLAHHHHHHHGEGEERGGEWSPGKCLLRDLLKLACAVLGFASMAGVKLMD